MCHNVSKSTIEGKAICQMDSPLTMPLGYNRFVDQMVRENKTGFL
jgi:hypothetical protein